MTDAECITARDAMNAPLYLAKLREVVDFWASPDVKNRDWLFDMKMADVKKFLKEIDNGTR